MDNARSTFLILNDVIFIVCLLVCAYLGTRQARLYAHNPKRPGETRGDVRRRLRALPEYRRSIPAMRWLITAMALSKIIDFSASVASSSLMWGINAAFALLIVIVWVMDREETLGEPAQH